MGDFKTFCDETVMKSQKPMGKAGKKEDTAISKSLDSYLDSEVTLIHQDLDQLKAFLAEHASLAHQESAPDARHVEEYYNSTSDLFRQVAIETGQKIPFDALCYDTYLLRKKKACGQKKK